MTVILAVFSHKRALLFGALLLCCSLAASVSQAQMRVMADRMDVRSGPSMLYLCWARRIWLTGNLT